MFYSFINWWISVWAAGFFVFSGGITCSPHELQNPLIFIRGWFIFLFCWCWRHTAWHQRFTTCSVSQTLDIWAAPLMMVFVDGSATKMETCTGRQHLIQQVIEEWNQPYKGSWIKRLKFPVICLYVDFKRALFLYWYARTYMQAKKIFLVLLNYRSRWKLLKGSNLFSEDKCFALQRNSNHKWITWSIAEALGFIKYCRYTTNIFFFFQWDILRHAKLCCEETRSFKSTECLLGLKYLHLICSVSFLEFFFFWVFSPKLSIKYDSIIWMLNLNN